MTLLALLVAWGPAACDSPSGPDEEEPTASGFRLMAEGVEVASASGATATGLLRVGAGEEGPPLEVVFLDARGHAVTPGTALSLEAGTHLPGVATLEVVSATGFTARLRGVVAGSTTARFTLLEGGAVAYISPPVDVRVDAGGP